MKKWLTENKIYFETAAAPLLGVMAVLVSISQVLLSWKQTELAEAQLIVAEQSISPSIHAFVVQVRNPETGRFSEEELRVYNLGAPALAADISNAVWLRVKLYPEDTGKNIIEAELPMRGYFSATEVTQDPEGLMFTLKGHRNSKKLIDLTNTFEQYAEKQGFYAEFKLSRFFEISYRDSLGQERTDYYSVLPLRGALQVIEDIGKAKLSGYRNSIGSDDSIDIDNVTKEELLNKILNF